MITQLSFMSGPLYKGLPVKMFVDSFGDKTKSLFGPVVAALLSRDEGFCQLESARLLQGYCSKESMKMQVYPENEVSIHI